MEELTLASQIKISPNPTNGNVSIELPNKRSEDWEMVFYDALGRELLQKKLPRGKHNVNILLQNFPSGVYFYKIKNELQIMKTGKIVKE